MMMGGDIRPGWMRTLQESTSNWLNALPEKLTPLRRTAENIKDPLYRFYEREVNLGCKILKRVRSDLRDIIAICRGEKKQTNDHRSIIDDLNRGMIPGSWVLYKIPSNSCTVIHRSIIDDLNRGMIP